MHMVTEVGTYNMALDTVKINPSVADFPYVTGKQLMLGLKL